MPHAIEAILIQARNVVEGHAVQVGGAHDDLQNVLCAFPHEDAGKDGPAEGA